MLTVHSQTRAIAQLQRALGAGRLGHTWMFAGPLGVGKFTLARELARTCMCDAPRQEANAGRVPQLADDFVLTLPCMACESCRAVDAGSHPDLHVITKDLIRYHDRSGTSKGTTLGIDVIRGEITGDTEAGKEAKIYKRSFRGRGKWFLIDEADLMQVPAQNALLKTLEEPPPESYLVMITTSPQELLSTIRSRSQTVLFGALPDEVVVDGLIGAGMAAEDAALMGRLARGSLGRALRWAEDMQVAARRNDSAAERAAKRGKEEEEPRYTPGGMLGWARALCGSLDGMVLGRVHASELAGQMLGFANEYAKLQLARDPLASEDRLRRDGLCHLLGVVADYFDDRLRQATNTPHAVPLPAAAAGLDPAVCRGVVLAAHEAEVQLGESNANVNMGLAAVTTRWEHLLRVPAAA